MKSQQLREEQDSLGISIEHYLSNLKETKMFLQNEEFREFITRVGQLMS